MSAERHTRVSVEARLNRDGVPLTFATDDELGTLVLRLLDVACDLVKAHLADHGTHEVLIIFWWALLDLLDAVLQLRLDLGPFALGHVESRKGRALLPLEFEGCTNGLGDDVVNVGGGVNEVEVLATGLTTASIANQFGSDG